MDAISPSSELKTSQIAPLTNSTSSGPRQEASIRATVKTAVPPCTMAGAGFSTVRAEAFISLVRIRRRCSLGRRRAGFVCARHEVRARRGRVLVFLQGEFHRVIDLDAHEPRSGSLGRMIIQHLRFIVAGL